MEREKIVWEFEQLYHSLKEHEYRLLARLEELDLAIYNSINGAISQFSCNISHLSGLIAQLEEKQQQPTRELLQVRLGVPASAALPEHLPSCFAGRPAALPPLSAPALRGPRLSFRLVRRKTCLAEAPGPTAWIGRLRCLTERAKGGPYAQARPAPPGPVTCKALDLSGPGDPME